MNLHPLILAGGSGTRLWPMSREAYPKQFLALLPGGTSPFQATVRRLESLGRTHAPTVIVNQEHRFLVADQIKALGAAPRRVYLEPCGRGTAPAIALAAHELAREDPEALMLVLPADHDIPD